VQLIEISDQFEELGINVAAMTYDPVDFLKEVELDRGVEFTLLHDEDISHVNRLGILNTDYEPGSRAYGVPYPGIFLLSPDGIIRYKFAEESYRDRPDFDFILEAAAEMAEQ
jgi:peroxiredoxin